MSLFKWAAPVQLAVVSAAFATVSMALARAGECPDLASAYGRCEYGKNAPEGDDGRYSLRGLRLEFFQSDLGPDDQEIQFRGFDLLRGAPDRDRWQSFRTHDAEEVIGPEGGIARAKCSLGELIVVPINSRGRRRIDIQSYRFSVDPKSKALLFQIDGRVPITEKRALPTFRTPTELQVTQIRCLPVR